MKSKEVFEFIQLNSRGDFNICSDDVEIIEVDDTEYGDAINIAAIPDDQTLENRYGDRLETTAFYIRSKNQRLPNANNR